MEWRIIYGKFFFNHADAEKEANELKKLIYNPRVLQGSSGNWLCVFYQSKNRSKIDEGYKFYKSKGLDVCIQVVV